MDSRRHRRRARGADDADLAVGTACTPVTLPANGFLTIPGATPIQLTAAAVYSPLCTTISQPAIIANGGLNLDQTASPTSPGIDALRDPFYASIFPQCYALAATTVLAYLLLIMLVIAPRSFLDGGVVVLGRRGFTNSPSNGISIGGRPWLQKVATLSVAVSLTIATVDTFRVAEEQYAFGNQNAQELQATVLGGTQLKVIQLISDTFLWLAQAQTLIRLFPRQREKVIIKWTAFSLISLDVIFGALNSFHYTDAMPSNSRPRNFTDAVPALSYLFQLSLGLLYAAWVIYYSITKKRYAFYHPLMKNICLMAILSIVSLLVPVVFFVLDIAEPEFTGWGDYVRWVGAAAASVVVWEWVERIEALEREEKKDGVLGREVFDGDEMIEGSPSDLSWPRRRINRSKEDDNDGGESANTSSNTSSGGRIKMWPAMSAISSRYRSRTENGVDTSRSKSFTQSSTTGRSAGFFLQPPLWPSRPPPAVTPVSRTDTASADSTVYAVRYLTETTSRTTDERPPRPPSRSESMNSSTTDPSPGSDQPPADDQAAPRRSASIPKRKVEKPGSGGGRPRNYLPHINLFHRESRAPPAEVLPHTIPKPPKPRREHHVPGKWDLRGRMEDFAASQAERILERMKPTPDTESLPITIIPAPPRRGAALAQLLEEEELQADTSETSRSLSSSPPQARATKIHSVVSSPLETPPRLISSNSDSVHLGRPVLSPLERNDVFQLTPINGRSTGPLTPPLEEDADNIHRSVSQRRPVPGISQDELMRAPI